MGASLDPRFRGGDNLQRSLPDLPAPLAERVPERLLAGTRVRATSTYIPSPVDQALVEQALHGRINALSQAFAYWLARKMQF